MSISPPAWPKQSRAEVEAILTDHHITDAVALVGIRGYYRDTMGQPGANDRGIYDDAIFLLSRYIFASFNANTDPSIARPGVAVLKPGVWRYKLGIHGLNRPAAQRYKALVQAAPVTVHRDGAGNDTGWFGINIHRGSRTTTSSLGCQTIVPDQWPAFIALVEQELRRAGQTVVPYVLRE